MADAEKHEKPNDSVPNEGAEGASAEPQPEDWPDSAELAATVNTAQEMAAYTATVRRIERMILVAGVVSTVAVLWPLGWALALGLLVGTALAWINFRWLAASVNALGERITKAHSQEKGAAVIVRGVGRIFLMALVGYVIFTCSVRGVVGFLTGLAMPVVALLCETVYELFAAGRRPL